jgi:hypothetical protein
MRVLTSVLAEDMAAVIPEVPPPTTTTLYSPNISTSNPPLIP